MMKRFHCVKCKRWYWFNNYFIKLCKLQKMNVPMIPIFNSGGYLGSMEFVSLLTHYEK